MCYYFLRGAVWLYTCLLVYVRMLYGMSYIGWVSGCLNHIAPLWFKYHPPYIHYALNSAVMIILYFLVEPCGPYLYSSLFQVKAKR